MKMKTPWVLLHTLILFSEFNVCQARGICSKIESIQNGNEMLQITKYFCCNNYEPAAGTCRECNTGYTSDAGKPCSPCMNNTYGEKCARSCRCTNEKHYMCDNIQGCIYKDDSNQDTTMTDINTAWDSITSTIIANHTTPVENFNYREHIIAVVFIALCFIVGFLTLSCCRYFNNESDRFCDFNLIIWTARFNTNRSHDDEQENTHAYDEIPEDQLVDGIEHPLESSITSMTNSTSTSSGYEIPSDGYLNPYNSVRLCEDFKLGQEDVQENHKYKTLRPSSQHENAELASEASNHGAEYLEIFDNDSDTKSKDRTNFMLKNILSEPEFEKEELFKVDDEDKEIPVREHNVQLENENDLKMVKPNVFSFC